MTVAQEWDCRINMKAFEELVALLPGFPDRQELLMSGFSVSEVEDFEKEYFEKMYADDYVHEN